MAIVSEIVYPQLDNRFDAEYYKPEYLEVERELKGIISSPLKQIVEFSKLRKDPTKDPDTEFGYIDITNIDIASGSITIQKIIGHQAPSRARKLVQTNNIIISTVRPNRNAVAIIPEELNDCICSTGFSVIKTEKINPYFLFAFLKSRYAIGQLVRRTMATMYPALSEEDIGTILVPVPPPSFQEHIEKLVKEAHEKRKLADQRYKEAEQLLYKELGIEKLELTREKTFETTYSEVEKAMRFDSEYYQPKYSVLMNELDKLKNVERLEEISKSIISGSYVKDYVPKGGLYLRVQNIQENEIDLRDIKFVNVEKSKIPEKIRVKPNDVLLTRTGTTGVAFVATKELEGAVISQHLTRIVLQNNINPDYVAVCLNSQICRLQMERPLAGSLQKELIHAVMKSIKIPILSQVVQEKIAEKIKESLELRKEAKNLLDQAKTEVEKLIEGV